MSGAMQLSAEVFPCSPRSARASDAAACAPLIYASGRQEFDFLFGLPEDRIVAFLRDAFSSAHGRFSWRRHYVAAAPDGVAIGLIGIQHGRLMKFDDVQLGWRFISEFGLVKAAAILWRGLMLKRELPAPARTQSHVTHCAVRPDVRGMGVFKTLFYYSLQETVRTRRGCDLVIDVLVTNVRASALYRQLGFERGQRSAPFSAALPPELESMRLRLRNNGSSVPARPSRTNTRKTYP